MGPQVVGLVEMELIQLEELGQQVEEVPAVQRQLLAQQQLMSMIHRP